MLNSYPAISVLSRKVDWITGIATSADNSRGVGAIAADLMRTAAENGDDLKPWDMYGFHGWHYKGGNYGYSGERKAHIIQVWSDHARDKWREIADYVDRCTRLDLAVDCITSSYDADMASRLYDGYTPIDSRRGRPSKIGLLQYRNHGSTLYVGSRSSEYYGRIYDKQVQANTAEYDCVWRFEVEMKGAAAGEHLALLCRDTDVQATIQNVVHDFYTQRGIAVPFRRDDASENTIIQVKHISDDARRMKYLDSAIRPMVGKLLNVYELDDIIRALGLDLAMVNLSSGAPQDQPDKR